ncbi:MAG: amidohydrolase family protein [Bacteroidia bacterium]
MIKNITITLVLVVNSFVFSQRPTPAPEQKNEVVIKNAILHVGNGKIIENAYVVFDKGVIKEIGTEFKQATVSASTNIIDASGKHVYPGIIATNNSLGLTEIEAVRATNDLYEVGSINPNANSSIAFFTDSKVIPTVRSNGILVVQSTPRGGFISGASSILNLDAWNYEDALIKSADGIHVNWPDIDSPNFNSDEKDAKEKTEKGNSYLKRINSLIELLSKAKNYSGAIEKDLKLEALKGLFDGSKKLYVHAQRYNQIYDAISMCKKLEIVSPVIVGGAESKKAISILKKFNVPVMLQRAHSLPPNSDADIDYFYKLPALLQKEGILFCLQYEGDMEAMGLRNLPFLAGTAIAYGLEPEQALCAITINAAKIIGIDKNYGSIEVGKSATLFISTGNALDMMTNSVEQAFIDGRNIDLNNHQKELYLRYSQKYGIKH